MANKITKEWQVGDSWLASDAEDVLKGTINDVIDDAVALSGDVQTNTTAIGDNTTAIGHNIDTLSTHTGLISDNASDIDDLQTDANKAPVIIPGTPVKFIAVDSNGKYVKNTINGIMGFDREEATRGKNLGIIQYCHSASSGEVHNIASDIYGEYTKLTSQTTFADGSALTDRTIIIYKDAGETNFSYWYNGELINVTTAKKLTLPVDFKGYIYLDDNGDLTYDLTKHAGFLIKSTVLVAYVYLNGAESELIWLADERHGILQNGETHLELHNARGFYWSSGFEATEILIDDATFTGILGGVGADEDIVANISSNGSIIQIPKLWRKGANLEWILSDVNNYYAPNNSGAAQFNNISTGTGVLEDVTGNDAMVAVIMASNNKLAPLIALVGQEKYTNRAIAKKRADSAYFAIKRAGLPSHEYMPLYSVILRANGTIIEGADGETGYDYRANGTPIMFFE